MRPKTSSTSVFVVEAFIVCHDLSSANNNNDDDDDCVVDLLWGRGQVFVECQPDTKNEPDNVIIIPWTSKDVGFGNSVLGLLVLLVIWCRICRHLIDTSLSLVSRPLAAASSCVWHFVILRFCKHCTTNDVHISSLEVATADASTTDATVQIGILHWSYHSAIHWWTSNWETACFYVQFKFAFKFQTYKSTLFDSVNSFSNLYHRNRLDDLNPFPFYRHQYF